MVLYIVVFVIFPTNLYCLVRMNTFEDSTGKKAHVTDLIKQHVTFPVLTFQ